MVPCTFYFSGKHIYYARKNKVKAVLKLEWPLVSYQKLKNPGLASYEGVVKITILTTQVCIYVSDLQAWREALKPNVFLTDFNDVFMMDCLLKTKTNGEAQILILRKSDSKRFFARSYFKNKLTLVE